MEAILDARLMATAEYIARYIHAGEKPVCEYVDGVLFQKLLGTKKHSQVQANITKLIRTLHEDTFNPLPELTTRLREGQFYVSDLAVEDLSKPSAGRYPGPDDPVSLCLEIVSPPDRVGTLFEVLQRV